MALLFYIIPLSNTSKSKQLMKLLSVNEEAKNGLWDNYGEKQINGIKTILNSS